MSVRVTKATYKHVGTRYAIHRADCKDLDQGPQEEPREFKTVKEAIDELTGVSGDEAVTHQSDIKVYPCAKGEK